MTQLGWFGSQQSATADQGQLGWFPVHPVDVPRETSEPVTAEPAAQEPAVSTVTTSEVATESPGATALAASTVPDVSRETDQATVLLFAGEAGEGDDVPRETLAPVVELRDVPRETDAALELGTLPELEPELVDEAPAVSPVPRETPVVERFPLPTETRIMTIANQKGGVGKTTTAVNMASALSAAGLKVLVLDLDPQGNASTALGIEHHSGVPGTYEVLVEGKPLADVVQQCAEAPDLWCAPATVDLAGAEIELVSMVARESRLQRAVTKYLKGLEKAGERRVDYVLIDCPPSLGLLTINAFVAAPEVLIPIQCEYYALEGLSQLLANIELIQEHLNPDLAVTTILLTMYDGRTRLAAQVVEEVRHHFGDQVLRSLVPRSVRISEAPSHGQTVMAYDPLSSGALAYLEAARELAQRGVHEEPAAAGDADGGSPPHVADPWARWTDGFATRRVASKEGGA
ncbi:ParA family protein [Kineococcus sp. SYSU DK003]|uniref:ParA family protein n=1 Tax=Kineococcus sp. SYSU DK003 TaxID=3383124 RepID=UPI003D7CCCB9